MIIASLSFLRAFPLALLDSNTWAFQPHAILCLTLVGLKLQSLMRTGYMLFYAFTYSPDFRLQRSSNWTNNKPHVANITMEHNQSHFPWQSQHSLFPAVTSKKQKNLTQRKNLKTNVTLASSGSFPSALSVLAHTFTNAAPSLESLLPPLPPPPRCLHHVRWPVLIASPPRFYHVSVCDKVKAWFKYWGAKSQRGLITHRTGS